MEKVIGFTLALLAFTTQPAAARLVNDMQSWIYFINKKLESTPPKYDDDDITTVREALDGCNQ